MRAEKGTGHLVMAGGYDDRVKENVEHFQELKRLSASLDLDNHITFLRSFSDAQKLSLLHTCTCLLYTPDKEHFGIVPIEAMCMQRPVIAVASGGPLETVADDETGFLCQPQPEAFAEAMKRFADDPGLARKMGEKGKERVEKLFSFEQFTEKLDAVVKGMTEGSWEIVVVLIVGLFVCREMCVKLSLLFLYATQKPWRVSGW